jgi:hypothetical protein
VADQEFQIDLSANDKASKIVDGLDKKLEALTDPKHEIEVSADDNATDDIKPLEKLLDGLTDEQKEIVLNAQVTAAEADIKRLDKSLGNIKDKDKLDIVIDARDSASDRLEQAVKLRDDLNAKKVEIQVDVSQTGRQALTDLDDGLKGVRDNADQSRSVLANMAGNTAQDLGQVGGVAGSAGVALGQLAEYASEGNISMSNLAKTAGPLLGLAAAGLVVQKAMQGIAEAKAFRKEQVEDFSEALKEGGDQAANLRDRLREIGKIEYSKGGPFGGTGDATKSLQNLGVSVERLSQAVTGSKDDLDAFVGSLYETNGFTLESQIAVRALTQNYDDYQKALKQAEEANKIFTLTQGDVNNALDLFLQKKDPVAAFPAEFQRIADALKSGTNPAVADLDAVTKGLNITVEEAISAADDLATSQSEATEEARKLAAETLKVEAAEIRAAAEARNLALDQKEAAQAAAAHRYEFEQLQNTLANQSSLIGVQQQFNTLEDAAAAAMEAGTKGGREAEDAMLAYEQTLIATKQKVADYAKEVLGLPADVVTDIVAELDPASGKTLADVEATLLNLSKGVSVPINYVEGRRPISGAYASGTDYNQLAGFYRVGENGPEDVYLPQGARVDNASQTRANRRGGGDTYVTNVQVTQNLPPGVRGSQVAAEARRYLRNNGRSI